MKWIEPSLVDMNVHNCVIFIFSKEYVYIFKNKIDQSSLLTSKNISLQMIV